MPSASRSASSTPSNAFQGEDAARKAAWNKERLGDFAKAAQRHGFRFHKIDGPGRPAYLDKRQPAAMQLVDLAVDKAMSGLGVAYQRHLSSVAHSKLHGPTRFLTPLAGAPPTSAQASINVSAPTIALELLAEPPCAANLVSGLRWFTGWDMDPGASHHAGRVGPDRRGAVSGGGWPTGSPK